MTDQSVVADLLDLKFDRLIARRLLSVIYVLALVLVGIGFLGAIITAFAWADGFGLVLLLLAAIVVTAVQVLVVRVLLEIAAAYFRIAEDVQAIRKTGPVQVVS